MSGTLSGSRDWTPLARRVWRGRRPASAQPPDRSQPPPVGPAPALRLPAIQKSTLANGVPLWVIEQHRVPLAQVNVILRGGSSLDRAGRYGMASLVARCSTRAPARVRRSSSPTPWSSSAPS